MTRMIAQNGRFTGTVSFFRESNLRRSLVNCIAANYTRRRRSLQLTCSLERCQVKLIVRGAQCQLYRVAQKVCHFRIFTKSRWKVD